MIKTLTFKPKRIFITGDTHGDFTRIEAFCKKMETTKEDMIIILGDVGINYYLSKRDTLLKKKLSEFPITLFSLYGNHECRPENIKTYEEKKFCNGIVYMEEEYPNLLFAKDGEVFNFHDKKVLVIGGSYSVDKYYRLMKGWAWFEDEQPSEEIKAYVEKQIKAYDYTFDLVLSHTCPFKAQPIHLFLPSINQSLVDNSTELWLQEIADKLTFTNWYYGHYHSDWIKGKYRLFFNDFVELE